MNARTAPKSQRERFEQAARELGVDLDEEKLKEALREIAPEKGRERTASHKKSDKPD